MTLRKLTVVFVAAAMMSIGFGMIFSDSASAAFIEPLSGNGLNPNFEAYDTAWNDAGTMAVVVGHGASSTPHAYAYYPGNDTYFALPNSNYNSNQYLYGVDYSYERIIPKPTVLLVDADFNEDGIINEYQSSLSVCNADVTYWDVWSFGSVNQGKPSAATLSAYDIVIWVPTRDMSGYNGVGDAFNSADEANIATYLDNGGNFMLANIYYTDYTNGGSGSYGSGNFAYDYLGISYIQNQWSTYDDYVNETVGDAVYDGVGQCWLDWTLYGWGASPDANDEISAGGGTICFWGTDSVMTSYYPMGIRHNTGTFKSVFLGFPFEVVSQNTQKDAIMKKTLEYFMPNSQLPTSASTALLVDADYYNEALVNAYDTPLMNNNWDVTVWDVYGNNKAAQGKPTSSDMAGYDLVIWIPTRDMMGDTGNGGAFDSLDEGQVSAYLGTGGNFFLSNIYWSDYSSGSGTYNSGDFAYDVFSISSMNNRYSDKEDTVSGYAGTIFDGFYPSALDWNQYGWSGQPWNSDEINSLSSIPALEIIKNSPYATGTGGVYYDSGSFKSMFMGFPVETLTASYLDDFWNRALEWFVPGSTSYNAELFSYQDVWWVCGDDAAVGINTAYRVVPSEGLSLQPVGTANPFLDVAVDANGNTLYVGQRNDMQYYDYLNDLWYSVGSGLNNYILNGVDYNDNDGRFYAVGHSTSSGQNSVWYTDIAPLDSGSAQAYEFNYLSQSFNSFNAIEWNPNLNYGLAVGDNMVYTILPYDYYGNGTLAYTIINTTLGYAYDVSWDTDGWNEAGIVGADITYTHALYWRYYDSNPIIQDGYSTSPPSIYRTCAMKPPSSPKWLFIPAAGGGVKASIMELDQSGQITLNADQPHIFTVDMWKQADVAQGSLLNMQVDADSTYTFFVEANYTVGGVDHWNDMQIELTAWYDGGNVGTASSPGDPTWSAADYRTRQFNITYDVGLATYFVNYPIAGASSPEFSVIDVWQDPATYGADGSYRQLYINVTFGKQTFVAANSFATGAATRPWDANFALNDANTWDLCVNASSTVSTSAWNASYEEFGINQYASISVMGSPSGSTPPGTSNYMMTTPSQITYSSNSNYYVNVSIPNLYKDGVVGPNFIPASNVAVQNTHSHATVTNSDISVQMNFIAPDTDYCVWGTPGIPLQTVLNGTQSAGPNYSDYTADSHSQAFEVTEVYWWVTVPAGLSEGTYKGTITFTIWHL